MGYVSWFMIHGLWFIILYYIIILYCIYYSKYTSVILVLSNVLYVFNIYLSLSTCPMYVPRRTEWYPTQPLLCHPTLHPTLHTNPEPIPPSTDVWLPIPPEPPTLPYPLSHLSPIPPTIHVSHPTTIPYPYPYPNPDPPLIYYSYLPMLVT